MSDGEEEVREKKLAAKTILYVSYCSNTNVTQFTVLFFFPQTAMNLISLSVDVSQALEVPAKDIKIQVQIVCWSVSQSVCPSVSSLPPSLLPPPSSTFSSLLRSLLHMRPCLPVCVLSCLSISQSPVCSLPPSYTCIYTFVPWIGKFSRKKFSC